MAGTAQDALSYADETELVRLISECYADPLLFVRRVFDWGHGELAGMDGPDEWQTEFLTRVGQAVHDRKFDPTSGKSVEPIREAVSSGHGIGKSCLVAWLILWIMSTRPYARGTVTAMTLPQLETKTWPELGKWWKRALNRHWFAWVGGRASLKFYHVSAPEDWITSGQTCREENSEAFAGQHNAQSTSFYIFDEASGIPDKIWEVSLGGLTDGEPMMFAFGNPTRNTGRFYEIFHKHGHRWSTTKIDSRTVKITNKEYLAELAEDHGEDSDLFRVRVRGEFPRTGSMQFIGVDVVDIAMQRDVVDDAGAALVGFADIARFGEDYTVIGARKGRNARTAAPWRVYEGLDTMQTATRIAEYIASVRPRVMFVDGAGVGGGIVDRLRQLGHKNVIDVNFGRKAADAQQFMNVKSECWARMRDWLDGGCIPQSDRLRDDLTGIEYAFDKAGRLKLESKDDMKKRGLPSPDWAEALALSFANEVARTDTLWEKRKARRARTDYSIFSSDSRDSGIRALVRG